MTATLNTDPPSNGRIDLSLVVPTFNERNNIGPLLAEIREAMDGIPWEIIFVDDSTDGTDEEIARISEEDDRIRLHHRVMNTGGLSGAVVVGFGEARGEYICVLDADLQHPPSAIPALLEAARRGSADVVVASRYMRGGGSSGLDGPLRRFYSRGLKWLSRAVFPRRLARVTDPLGGFFLLRRSLVQDTRLRPVGYKILLEVLVRTRWTSLSEVPYNFRPRVYDQSKAGLREGFRFLLHLGRLAWECSPVSRPLRAPVEWVAGPVHRVRDRRLEGGARRLTRFVLVGASGVVVNMAVFGAAYANGLHYLPASVIAIETALTSNYLLNNRWTFADRRGSATNLSRFLRYHLVCAGGMVVNIATLHGLVSYTGVHPVPAELGGIVAAAAWNFALSLTWAWRQGPASREEKSFPSVQPDAAGPGLAWRPTTIRPTSLPAVSQADASRES